MLLKEVNPFVRYAAKTSYLPNKDFTVAYDSRIFYVISGNGTFYLEDKCYPIECGSLVYYPAGVKYYPCSSEDEPFNFITINFDYTINNIKKTQVIFPVHVVDYREENIIEKIFFSDASVLNDALVINNMQSIEHYLNEIVKEYTGRNDVYQEIASGLLKVVLSMIVRNAVSEKKNSISLERLLSYIHKNYYKNINNISIGKSLNYHPYYLNSIIKKYKGVSLHKYIMSYRIKTAINLILTTDMPIYEIAEKTGFVNANHFSNYFKKATGKTPSYYRTYNNM